MDLKKKIYKSILKVLPKKNYYPLSEPEINSDDVKFVQNCLKTGWVSSNGTYLKKFEENLNKILKKKYIVPVINGTSALHLALIASGIKKNEEVLIPDLSYISAANSVNYIGAVPNFVDIDLENYSICPKKLKIYLKRTCIIKSGFLFNKKTRRFIKGLILVHVFGYPGHILEIKKICKRFKLKFIEDSSECLGSYYMKKHLGTFSDYGVLSFNGNKIITSGGGGCIITDDDELAKRAKHITTTAKIPHNWEYAHDEVGYNYRMPNINAALLCAQLENIDLFIKNKRKLAKIYQSYFDKIGIKFIIEPKNSKSNYWLNTLVLKDKNERDNFLTYLNNNGVMSRPIWNLMSTLGMYKDSQQTSLLNAEYLADRVVNLPSSVRIN